MVLQHVWAHCFSYFPRGHGALAPDAGEVLLGAAIRIGDFAALVVVEGVEQKADPGSAVCRGQRPHIGEVLAI